MIQLTYWSINCAKRLKYAYLPEPKDNRTYQLKEAQDCLTQLLLAEAEAAFPLTADSQKAHSLAMNGRSKMRGVGMQQRRQPLITVRHRTETTAERTVPHRRKGRLT
jgi:hypothetical protein